VPTGIRYDEDALLAMKEPVLLRVTEPVKDIRDWAEQHIYAPLGYAPALDNDGRISPVNDEPDYYDATIIDNEITEPVPDWAAGERVYNDLTYQYPRYFVPSAGTVEAVDGILVRDVIVRYVDEQSIERHGEQVVDYDGIAFGAIGDGGAAATGTERGAALAQGRYERVFLRYRGGAELIRVPVMREVSAHLRAGSWVACDLSWMPNTDIGRRGLLWGGQVIGVHDLDCAWRELLIERADMPDDYGYPGS
jgi:hypothetical protein